jgi:hypothetical protein
MELTYEEAQKMIQDRLREYPVIAKLVSAPTFKATLSDILTYEKIDAHLLPVIENEVMVILTFYAPVSELAVNISETTGLPEDKAKGLATMINALLFLPIYNELLAFDILWHEELEKNKGIPEANLEVRDPLELRPAGAAVDAKAAEQKEATAKPLTREELMNALAGKRTMASDIEAVRKAREEAKKE